LGHSVDEEVSRNPPGLTAQIAVEKLKRETANEFVSDPSPLFFRMLL
jgi:hypothetical protein